MVLMLKSGYMNYATVLQLEFHNFEIDTVALLHAGIANQHLAIILSFAKILDIEFNNDD